MLKSPRTLLLSVLLGAALLTLGVPARATFNFPALFGPLTGDCTTPSSSSATITCTKSNGSNFSPSATVDATNGANVTITVPGGAGRTAVARAQDEVNVNDIIGGTGVYGDYTTAFNTAFSTANSTGKVVRIPCGGYTLSSTIETYGVSIRGDGPSCVFLQSAQNAPIFKTTINSGSSMQYKDVGGFLCRSTIAAGAAYSTSACYDFEGDGASYVVNNYFHDIQSQGTYANVSSSKGNSNGPFGYEARVSTNVFARITANGFNNPAKYRFWFKTGSGTANVFEHMSGGSEPTSDTSAAVIRYEGTDPQGHPVVVGDVTVGMSQFQGPTKIVSVGAGSVYNDNIQFPGDQFDGVGNPVSYDATPAVLPQGLHVSGDNIGGGIDVYTGLGTSIQSSVVSDRQDSQWSAGNTKGAATTAVAYFMVEVGGNSANAGYNAPQCTLEANGLLGGLGSAWSRQEFILRRSGTGSTIYPLGLTPRFANSDGSYAAVDGGASGTTPQLKITAVGQAAASGATAATATFSVTSPSSATGGAIEALIECKGGQFRVKRL